MDSGIKVLIALLVGLVIGFFVGRHFEANQRNQIDIKVPGFQYQQR